ncbi:MAG: response regulator [Thioalkalispiraceae bacterium]|jgi:CheY-like chemotaxis protein
MEITIDHILIVDDFPDVRESLAEVLEGNGKHVTTAENGKEAINVIKQQTINLVISDILMPEMDGLELINETRKLYPEMKFILITGGSRYNDDFDYLEMCENLTGIKALLKKPFDTMDLINMVDDLLAH